MKDFNFFEPYLNKKETSSYNKLALYAISSVVLLGLIIYPLINIFRINSLGKNIAAMKIDLESSSTYERLNIVEEKIEKVSQMETQLSLLKNINQIIEERDIVNDLLLNTITSKVPNDIFFSYISLLPTQIQIQGVATNNLAIAQLENSLKNVEEFEEIFIPNISLNEGLYHFSITFAINDTKQNDIEQKDVE